MGRRPMVTHSISFTHDPARLASGRPPVAVDTALQIASMVSERRTHREVGPVRDRRTARLCSCCNLAP